MLQSNVKEMSAIRNFNSIHDDPLGWKENIGTRSYRYVPIVWTLEHSTSGAME